MPLRSIAFLLFFTVSSAVSLVHPMAGVVGYLALYHVYPQTTWWGKPLAFLGARWSFICGTCLLIGTALNLNRLRFGRRFLHPVEVGMLVTLLAIILSTATGTVWDERTETFLDKMMKVFLFAFLFSHVVVTRQQLWQVVVVLNLAALYLGHEAYVAPRGAFEGNRLNGIGGPDFQESSGLAIHLCALLPFVLVLFRQRSWLWKGVAFLAAGFSVNAVLLCRTRSATVAAAVAGLLSLIYAPRHHRRWLGAMLGLGVVGVVILGDAWFWERMATIVRPSEGRDQSADTRLVIWSAAWEMIRANPLGVGVGHFSAEIGRYARVAGLDRRDAHNSFLLCAAETGWLGLAAYLATLFMAWRTLTHLARQTRRDLLGDDRLELIVFANRMALLVYMVGGLFSSRFYMEGQWILIALTVCTARVVENELRALREPMLLVQDPEYAIPSAGVPAL
ncbi:MAG: O-antigen ligase family protein [Phycisphaerae bacterium]|jgi:O-antigen ligase